jgi:hypothetical protein
LDLKVSFLQDRTFIFGLLDRLYKTIEQKHGDKLGMPPRKLLGTTHRATKTSKPKKNLQVPIPHTKEIIH